MKRKFKNPQKVSFRKPVYLLAFFVCLLCVGSVSILHLRGEVAESASNIRKYENELAELERKNRAVDIRVAHLHQPATLKTLLDYHSLDLQEPVRGQVHMVRNEKFIMPKMHSDKNVEIAEVDTAVNRLHVDLALLNLTRTSR